MKIFLWIGCFVGWLNIFRLSFFFNEDENKVQSAKDKLTNYWTIINIRLVLDRTDDRVKFSWG